MFGKGQHSLKRGATREMETAAKNPSKSSSPYRKSLPLHLAKSLFKWERYAFLLPLLTLFLVWETTVDLGLVSRAALPPPSEITATLIANLGDSTFLNRTLLSFVNISIGILISLFIAVHLAIMVGLKPRFDVSLTPNIMIYGALPETAILLFLVYWFGPGTSVMVMIIIIHAFFPIFFMVREGVKEIPLDYFHVATIYKASKFNVYRKLVLPAILPQTITGLRVAFDAIWGTIVAIEIFANVSGIGSLIHTTLDQGQAVNAFAGLFMIGIIAITFDRLVFGAMEFKVSRWYDR